MRHASQRDRVSIHAPARGATLGCRSCSSAMARFQSTPPRGGRLRSVPAVWQQMFQSTPPRGGRRYGSRTQLIAIMSFNPRPRAGGDAGPTVLATASIVSIHAPARGATAVELRSPDGYEFQSTPPRGGRLSAVPLRSIGMAAFQSTPPRGGRRRAEASDRSASGCFNPRPRAGGDSSSESPRRQHVSIHAPARGATAVGAATA